MSKRKNPPQRHALRSPSLSRRDVLKGLVALEAASAITAVSSAIAQDLPQSPPPPSREARPDLIARENQRPGTRDWMLSNTRIDPKTKYRCPWIEGYCSHTSV